MPAGTGERGLPSAKTWKQWSDVRLSAWAAACEADFEDELDHYAKGVRTTITNQRANWMLA